MANAAHSTTVLVILDGFGFRAETRDNAIAAAHTPNLDRILGQYEHTLISGSGLDVGLPEGQMGNSEVGHMSLGAGRIVYQSITRIDKAIADGEFQRNPAYLTAIDGAIERGKAVHVMGLLSNGGVHSHQEHIFEVLRLAVARGANHVYLHAFLDGRDTPPKSAGPSLDAAEALFTELGCGRIASIHGRFWAMDRDNRWDRIEKSFAVLTEGQTEQHASSAAEGLAEAYNRGETDEFVAPTIIGDTATITDGDCVLFMNFRADRARQLSAALTQDDFSGFERRTRPAAELICTAEYSADLACPVAFPPETLNDSIGEWVANKGLKQLRIAETEKYAHVTFFFSGGREATYTGEERVLIPSPKVETYDLQPEMSAPEVTQSLVAAIRSGNYDLIVVNYANGDMVGHTGVFDAAVAAVETLDHCLGEIEKAVIESGSQALITADHGNCEQMLDYDSGQAHTQHTTEFVPLIHISQSRRQFLDKPGILADVAPTLLDIMGLEMPSAMTGRSLLTGKP